MSNNKDETIKMSLDLTPFKTILTDKWAFQFYDEEKREFVTFGLGPTRNSLIEHFSDMMKLCINTIPEYAEIRIINDSNKPICRFEDVPIGHFFKITYLNVYRRLFLKISATQGIIINANDVCKNNTYLFEPKEIVSAIYHVPEWIF